MTSLERADKSATTPCAAGERPAGACDRSTANGITGANGRGGVIGLVDKLLRGDTTLALITAFILALTFLTIPRRPLTDGMESSWSAVLGYAHQHGLQFGTDIIYTYGPLGFLSIFYFAPDTAGLRLAVDLALCFGVAAGVCLLAWRLSIGWRVVTLVLFMLVTANVHSGTQDLLLDLGFLCWGLLCVCESRPRLRLYLVALVALADFSALTKVTGLVLAGLTVAALASDLWLRRRRRLGVALVMGTVLGFLGGWAALGQRVSHIPAYLAGGLRISGGYNGAMGLEPTTWVLTGGVLTLLTAVAAGLTGFRTQATADLRQRWRQRLLFAWLLSLLFITWKHGFVRADAHHVILFLGFAPVLALVLGALPWHTSRQAQWTSRLAGACCASAIITLQLVLYPDYLHLEKPFYQAVANAATLLSPGSYHDEMERALRLERYRAELPKTRELVGKEAVDVFGNYQTYAVLNELHYSPRPVFQSYSSYTAPLTRINEAFYASSAAPKLVLARLGTIDDKLPVIEDALAFRYLLKNYAPIGQEGGFLLLKSRSAVTPGLTLLAEGAVQPGERIDLKRFGQSTIWLEIDLKPTAAGRLRQFVYQPSVVRLAVWDGAGETAPRRFRAPPPMMAVGFVASPLVLSNDTLADSYAGKPVARPKAYSVEIEPASRWLWQGRIPYRAYRIR